MSPILVDTYYLQVGTNLEITRVINGPVYLSDQSETKIGLIIGYNPETGFGKIRLFHEIYYQYLAEEVPIENIIFPSQA